MYNEAIMTYLKSLLINFLTVFFVDHLVPGIDIPYYTKLPHVEGGLIFAAAVGFVNSLIFPMMRLFRASPSHVKIGLTSFIISFAAYSIVNLLPLEIKVTTIKAYFWCGAIVWLMSYFTNHLEYSHYLKGLEDKAAMKQDGEKKKDKG